MDQKVEWTFYNKNFCKICVDRSGPEQVCTGENLQYKIKVTNCSETPSSGDTPLLYNVKAVDPVIGLDKNIGSLALGTSYEFTSAYITKPTDPNPFKNTLTVSGEHSFTRDGSTTLDTTTVSASNIHSLDLSPCTFTAEVCGMKFDDGNGNGRFDEGEVTQPGVPVTLFTGTLNPLQALDIGDGQSENGYNLQGWGPVEPDTHGGTWGGIATDPQSPDKKTRVARYKPTRETDDPSAGFSLDAGASTGNLLQLRVLDGIADDSFDLSMNNKLFYSYMGKNNPESGGFNLFGDNAGPIESWHIHQIFVPYADELNITVTATGAAWPGFDTYGQLAVDWAKLYILQGNAFTAATDENGKYCFQIPGLKKGEAYTFYLFDPAMPGGRTSTTPTFIGPIILSSDNSRSMGNDFGGSGCTLSHGYWKNHPESWPVDSLKLGTQLYDKEALLKILKEPARGNGLISLAHQLISAKLNIAAGASLPLAIKEVIQEADTLIVGLIIPPLGNGYIKPSQTGGITETLDDYNNGLIPGGPRHCSE